jgi:hypothetical protein
MDVWKELRPTDHMTSYSSSWKKNDNLFRFGIAGETRLGQRSQYSREKAARDYEDIVLTLDEYEATCLLRELGQYLDARARDRYKRTHKSK